MPNYRVADLAPAQLRAIEDLENRLHVTLVAYQPSGESAGTGPTSFASETTLNSMQDGAIMDALVDTYRTFELQ